VYDDEWEIYIAKRVREWLDGLDDATHVWKIGCEE
jgi:hypothetical protein